MPIVILHYQHQQIIGQFCRVIHYITECFLAVSIYYLQCQLL